MIGKFLRLFNYDEFDLLHLVDVMSANALQRLMSIGSVLDCFFPFYCFYLLFLAKD
jgi:hypothetical protein